MIHQLDGDHEASLIVQEEEVERLTLVGWRLVAVLERTVVEEGRKTVPKPVKEGQRQSPHHRGYVSPDPDLYELAEPLLVTQHSFVLKDQGRHPPHACRREAGNRGRQPSTPRTAH